jgi:uroporphyrin-III C-methyltransferase
MNTNKKIGSVLLVGAGPGDPELITLKGMKAIQRADVILYDALVNTALLDYNLQGEKIFVGKRRGYKRFSQEMIQEIMIAHALEGKKVLRLKGGDPMIFGRAWEEVEAVRAANIDLEIIPGISAFSGVAAVNQVPITRRCVSESLWICTGTTCEGSISSDIHLAAQSSATVIIYMGMSNLEAIIEAYKQHKSPNFPVAIIQNATTPLEKIVVGTLSNIVERKVKYEIDNPALIIMGTASLETRTGMRTLGNYHGDIPHQLPYIDQKTLNYA